MLPGLVFNARDFEETSVTAFVSTTCDESHFDTGISENRLNKFFEYLRPVGEKNPSPQVRV